jgi:hypothetical protein
VWPEFNARGDRFLCQQVWDREKEQALLWFQGGSMHSLVRSLPALLLAVFLQACGTASSIPELPDQLLNEEGILVARVYMPGNQVWQNSRVTIDGHTWNMSLRDGYLAVPLRPGSHTLNSLRVEGWQSVSNGFDDVEVRTVKGGGGGYRPPIYTYTPGSTVYYTTLPVNRVFTIETGIITNLGMLTFLVDDSDKEKKKFFTIATDNSADMRRFLEANYPKLMSTIDSSKIKLDPAKYLDPKKLPELRRTISAREALSGRVIPYGRDMLSYGGLGSITVFKMGPDGKFSGADVLDTGTMADVVDVRVDGNRATFLTSDATLLYLDDGKLERRPLPFNRHTVRMHRFGSSGLAVIDNRLRISTSNDLGRSWKDYTGAQIETPSGAIGVANGKAGFYVFSPNRGSPTSVIYRPNDSDNYRLFSTPTRGTIPSHVTGRLVERPEGLYLVYWGNQSFHVLQNGRPLWFLHNKPDRTCKELMFDDAKNTLRTKCDSGTYESNDTGATWVGPKA